MRMHLTRGLVCAVALLAPASRAAAQAGVTVALSPGTINVSPGDEFDVYLQVTQAGDDFNGFDAIVSYDPAALTFVQLSPVSLQEGSLLTSACGNRFHKFRAGADRDTITDVLLCSGVTVTGPGPVYQLHFRASTTPQATKIQFVPGSTHFYNGGLFVLPLTTSDANVGIGVVLDVPAAAPAAGLRIAPNPVRGVAFIHLPAPERGAIVILDPQGRAVRHLDAGGATAIRWDGRDDAGARLPAGAYWVRTAAGRTARAMVLP